jgi:AcrR family transcriptional regulator
MADESGLDAATLAALAGRLGVKPPALYKHVDGLGELRHRIAALAMSELGDALQGRAGADALTALSTVPRGTPAATARPPGRSSAAPATRC